MPDATAVLDPVRPLFRELARAIVPEAADLDDGGWRELEGVVEGALAKRPAAVQRQLGVFIRLLGWLPVLRWGRTFRSLDPARRARFLHGVQDSRLFLIRRGFWGLRTLVLMGYYARPTAYEDVGYGAKLRGWLEHPDAPADARATTAAHADRSGGRAPGHEAKPGGAPPAAGHIPPPVPGEAP